MKDLTLLSACDIVEKIKKKEIKAVDVCRAYLNRVSRLNKDLNAFVFVDQDAALSQAKLVDKKVNNGEPLGAMAGVPVAIKDNISQQSQPLTACSRIMGAPDAPYISPYDAFVVECLRNADAVMLGRTNMDEFAMGSSTETSAYGVARNPWNRECVPGGSSGGSAIAVAARMSCVALGSDTGGSVRQPASFCGVVGLKPTYGEVSRYGLMAFASSLDQIGPFARNVDDIALLMSVISRHDCRDATSIATKSFYPDYSLGSSRDISKLKIAVLKQSWDSAVSSDVQGAMRQAQTVFQDCGATVEEVDLPINKFSVGTYFIIAMAEAGSNLGRYDGVEYGFRHPQAETLSEMYLKTRTDGFGSETTRRIFLGTYVLSAGYYDAYYKKALRVKNMIYSKYRDLFTKKGFDALLLPTVPSVAFPIGSKINDPLQMYLSDVFTVSANLSRMPAISLPSGLSSEGLPLSIQLMTNIENKSTLDLLLSLSKRYQDSLQISMNCPI